MRKNATQWPALLLLVFMFLVACQDEADPCVSACRSVVDCDVAGESLNSVDKRVLQQTCVDQCVAEDWSETLTSCLIAAKGYCVYVDGCNPTESGTEQ